MQNDDDLVQVAQFRLALFELQKRADAVFERFGISASQWHALLIARLGTNGEKPTIGDIARVMEIHPSSASGLIARLEKAGYLRRQFDLEQRRNVRVELTTMGEDLIREVGEAEKESAERIRGLYKELLS